MDKLSVGVVSGDITRFKVDALITAGKPIRATNGSDSIQKMPCDAN